MSAPAPSQPESTTDWVAVGEALRAECSSPSLRATTARLLARVQAIGPTRPAPAEFRRVYKSLQWNEPERVGRVLDVLQARTRGARPQTTIRAEAWDYTIAALDEWISHARVYYLVTGILEGTLRARLHTRLTDYYGTPDWPNEPKAVPSGLLELIQSKARARQFKAVEAVLAKAGRTTTPTSLATFEQEVRNAATLPAPDPLPRGDAFLRERTTLGDLLMWFEAKRFWGESVRLAELFGGRDGRDAPPQFQKLKAVIGAVHAARNEAAHYRPGPTLSFVEPFFAAATLARWLGEDLQHVYSAIDFRASTELSMLLGPVGRPGVAGRGGGASGGADEVAVSDEAARAFPAIAREFGVTIASVQYTVAADIGRVHGRARRGGRRGGRRRWGGRYLRTGSQSGRTHGDRERGRQGSEMELATTGRHPIGPHFHTNVATELAGSV